MPVFTLAGENVERMESSGCYGWIQMATIQRFEQIEAWVTARELTKLVYALSSKGAFAKDFGLKDQMRRAAVSVMSNIAEGFESRTRPRFIDYLGIAKASCAELRSQPYVALDAAHVTQTEFEQLLALAEKCIRQISNFMEYLTKTSIGARPKSE